MTKALIDAYGPRPVVYAGGVMSNQIIRKALESRFDAYFAKPRYSADNSAGVCILAARKLGWL